MALTARRIVSACGRSSSRDPTRSPTGRCRRPPWGPTTSSSESREAGLCRTDIEMMTGVFTDPRWVRFPVIPGHEWAGTVVEVGADVTSVAAGDRVVCEGMIACHRCGPCRRGETHWCERIEALGFTRPGGYAELVAVPEQVVHRLPEHVSFDAGVLVEPASVVLRGLEKARPQTGRGGRRDRRRHARLAGDRAAARCTRRRGSSPTACARRSSSSRGSSAPPRSSSRATARRRRPSSTWSSRPRACPPRSSSPRSSAGPAAGPSCSGSPARAAR